MMGNGEETAVGYQSFITCSEMKVFWWADTGGVIADRYRRRMIYIL